MTYETCCLSADNILTSYPFAAHWCFEPKESGLLCRTVWDMGRWSDSTLSLQHPLLYIYFYFGLACSYCKYFWILVFINVFIYSISSATFHYLKFFNESTFLSKSQSSLPWNLRNSLGILCILIYSDFFLPRKSEIYLDTYNEENPSKSKSI